MKIINLGCGEDMYGDVRVDFKKTSATTHLCDLNNPLPFKNEEFDEVYAKSVLEHIKNVGLFIEEMKRILKKGGKLKLITDNASFISFHFRSHQDYITNNYKTISEDKHYFLFKKEHLQNLFSSWKNVQIKFMYPPKKLFFLPKQFRCMHLVLEATK